MGKGSECRNRKTSPEAVVLIQALMVVAWTRMVAAEVTGCSWILGRSC